jgi:hypothetical protein
MGYNLQFCCKHAPTRALLAVCIMYISKDQVHSKEPPCFQHFFQGACPPRI